MRKILNQTENMKQKDNYEKNLDQKEKTQKDV